MMTARWRARRPGARTHGHFRITPAKGSGWRLNVSTSRRLPWGTAGLHWREPRLGEQSEGPGVGVLLSRGHGRAGLVASRSRFGGSHSPARGRSPVERPARALVGDDPGPPPALAGQPPLAAKPVELVGFEAEHFGAVEARDPERRRRLHHDRAPGQGERQCARHQRPVSRLDGSRLGSSSAHVRRSHG